jgi:hypothetical protein
MAWRQFSSSSYPWLIMSFATAAFTSFLIDWHLPTLINSRFSRLASGLIQAVVLSAAASMVHLWLTNLSANHQFEGQVPEIGMVLRVSMLTGFALGYMVPYWYHAKEEQEELQKDETSETGEVSSATALSKPDYAVITRVHDNHG